MNKDEDEYRISKGGGFASLSLLRKEVISTDIEYLCAYLSHAGEFIEYPSEMESVYGERYCQLKP